MINGMTAGAWIRRSAALLVALVAAIAVGQILATPHVARADCAVSDPTCVTEPVGGAVEDPVGTIEEAVGPTVPPVPPVEETIDETVQTVEETIEETVQTVEDTVDDVLGGGGGEEPVDPDRGRSPTGSAPGSATGSNPPGSTSPGDGPAGANDEPGGDAGVRPRPSDELVTAFAGSTLVGATPAAEPVAQGAGWTNPVAREPGYSGVADDVVAAFAFPALLGLIAAAFVALQGRLDRRDPKLAIAPVGPDLLSFT